MTWRLIPLANKALGIFGILQQLSSKNCSYSIFIQPNVPWTHCNLQRYNWPYCVPCGVLITVVFRLKFSRSSARSSLLSSSSSSPSSSSLYPSLSLRSPQRFLGDHVILFSFFSRRLAFANQVDTCVKVIFVKIANIIFSPLVGYGFLRCS